MPKTVYTLGLLTFRRYLTTVATSSSRQQRCELRHRTSFQARLKNTSLEETALVTNVSLSGLQLECSGDVFNRLRPSILHPDPRSPLHVNVIFQILDGARNLDLDLPCQLLYARRLSKDRYLLGARICKEEMPEPEDQLSHLRGYLRQP